MYAWYAASPSTTAWLGLSGGHQPQEEVPHFSLRTTLPAVPPLHCALRQGPPLCCSYAFNTPEGHSWLLGASGPRGAECVGAACWLPCCGATSDFSFSLSFPHLPRRFPSPPRQGCLRIADHLGARGRRAEVTALVACPSQAEGSSE